MKKNLSFLFWNLEEIVAGAALAMTLIITTGNVLYRYILRNTIAGYNDLAVLGFSWCIFIGISACYKRGMHYGVDVLMTVLPEKLQPILSFIIHLLLVLGCAFSTKLSWQLLIGTLTGTGRVTSYLHIPYGWMYFPAVMGFALMTFHSIRFLYLDVKNMHGSGAAAQQDDKPKGGADA